MDAPFEHDTDQLVITPELLALMEHIVENCQNELKDLVTRAYQTQNRQRIDVLREGSIEQAQSSILDFLGLMEFLLYETTREHEQTANMQRHLMPSIQRIDTSTCASDVVDASIEKATNKIKRNPQSNPQEILFKELLKRWKPAKKTVLN